jgi:hypothetical protein
VRQAKLARSSQCKSGPGRMVAHRPVASVASGKVTTSAKRTQQSCGVGLSHEMPPIAEAETVGNVEGNIGGAVMRGAVTLPGSETTSRRKGMRRNLGNLLSPAVAAAAPGRIGKLGRATPIRKRGGVGRVRTTVEAPEQGCEEQRRRVWREGTRPGGVVDAEACPGHSAGLGLSQKAPTRGSKLNGPPKPRMSITLDFRQEPGARKPHAGICGGGAG